MSSMLSLREGVSFDASGGWHELLAHPAALADAGWQRWLAALPGRKDDVTLNEVADYFRSAKRIGPLRVLAQTDDGSLLFVFVLHERGPEAMRARVERIVRWTGVSVDSEHGTAAQVSYVGDSPGTKQWGLASVVIRAYPEAGIVVFAAAADDEAVHRALTRFKLPEPSIPPPSFEQLRHLAPDGLRREPGPAMRALLDRLGAARVTTELEIRLKGTLDAFLGFSASGESGGERWRVQAHDLATTEEAVGFLARLAETGATLDLSHAKLQVRQDELVRADADHLNLHTAWTQALGEIFRGVPPVLPGTVACTTDWGYFVDPSSMEMAKVEGCVPVGALVLDKIKWGREVLTHAYVATKDGLVRLADKAAVLEHLTSTFLASARANGTMPRHVTRGKSFKNGNVELHFEPTRFDRWVLRLSKDLVGEDPTALLDRLRPRVVAPKKPVADETWIAESAKSDRSTCRTCGKTIEKGTLRRGEPHEYQGSISYRWHHDACVTIAGSDS